MDSTSQDPFTRRMLQRAASVRRNKGGSLRCSLDDSRRRMSILQAIGDNKPVKIADVEDCRIISETGSTPIGTSNVFAGDKQSQPSLRRTNFTISDSLIPRRSCRLGVPSFSSKSQSNSTHLTNIESKSNFDCKSSQDLQISSRHRITRGNYKKRAGEDQLDREEKNEEYNFNNETKNLQVDGNNFINEIMALEKSEKPPRRRFGGTGGAGHENFNAVESKFEETAVDRENNHDESRNSLNLTQTFNSTSLNLTGGNSTRDSALTSPTYTNGFELGNVKWRGPLYRASVKTDKKKDQDHFQLDRGFGIEEKTEPFPRLYNLEKPELVTAMHKHISPPKKMTVEMKTIGNYNDPKIISGTLKNSGENNSGNGKPERLALCVNTFEIDKLKKQVNGKIIESGPDILGSPTTPLSAEIKKLDDDIKQLDFCPGFYTPENGIELSPPNQIYPNLSKIHFTPTGYTPKKLYQSPCSPENYSESSDSKKPAAIIGDKNGWNFEKNSSSKFNYASKNIDNTNHPLNVSKKTITGDETNTTDVVTAEIESNRFVKNQKKVEKNDKFKPNMESTRKSSMTDISKNTTCSPGPRESTVSSVTLPPNTPEGVESAGTTSSPNEKNITLNSTVPYNVDDFLADALGDELYNTTVTYPPSEAHEKSISQFNASELISEERTPLQRKNKRLFKKIPMTEPPPQQSKSTFNRTMTIYRSFTQRIKNKLRPGLKAVPKVATNDDITMTVDSGFEDKKIQALLQEANIQHTLMYQANKALNLCRSMKEFVSSTEQVESERSLLVAGLRRAAALEEIKKLGCELNNNDNDSQSCESGEVVIKDFSLPLREDILKHEAQTGDFVQWFVIAVTHREKVWVTRAVSCPIKSPKIIFNGGFSIPNLSPDFKISVRIYALKMPRATYNYDDKYHLNQAEKHSRCPSPKQLILRKSDKSLSPKGVQQVEFSAIRNTSFVLSGMVELYLHDLSLAAPWPLTSLLPGSVLRGTIDLSLSCKLHLSVSHAGFLTHGDEAGGFAAWNRRWCVLQGQTLRFWNYPCDQEDKEPLTVIDLTNCISEEIDVVDRSMCAKPRTLMIETVRRKSILDRNSMLLECRLSCTIVRNLLCCDTARDFVQWKSKLNHVVSALRDWNVTNRSPDVQVSDL